MYEGQTIICQSVIEENWLEYLAFVKQQADKEDELSRKRQEALAGIESSSPLAGSLTQAAEKMPENYRHYYDLGINGFWNWYITYKVK